MEKNSQNTEEKILEAAEREFLKKGFASARTTSIAEAAGVTHAMLHYYFRSKEKLFDKIIEEKVKLLQKLVMDSVHAPGKSLFERLRLVIERHLDFVAANPDLPRFFIGEVYSQPGRFARFLALLGKTADKMFAMLQAQIDTAAGEGLCRRVDARMLVLDMVSLNVFSFVAAPVVEPLLGNLFEDGERFLEERKRENVETIMRKLKI